MENFDRKQLKYTKNDILLSGHALSELLLKNKTPFYVYSETILENNFSKFTQAIKKNKQDALVCFAMKSNNNINVLRSLGRLGAGADIVSGGELKQALKAGISASKIVFSGVGKTEDEISFGIKKGIYSFNVESIEELKLINEVATKLKKTARVAFRLNPKVHAKTHKHISTGYKTHKFGMLEEDILSIMKIESLWTNIKLVGLSVHIGSQLTCLKATLSAVKKLCLCAKKLNTEIEFIDVGGGLGVNYTNESLAPTVLEYITEVNKIIIAHFPKIKVVYEPGRRISASAGFFVTKIIRTKTSENCRFLIVDGGMNDFVRPSLYDAFHEIYPSRKSSKLVATDIVGPICETADCFGTNRKLPLLEKDDYVIIADTGAYGHSMSSTYNMRTLPKEIFLSSDLKKK
jgi:diaminopimelate decarboxylase